MTPKAIVNAMENRLGLTGSPGQLRDAIEKELLASGMGAASAAEQVDVLRKKVTAEIKRRWDERVDLGEIAILNLRGDDGEIVFGSSYVFGDDSDPIKQSKLNRISADEIFGHIRNLTFAQFERFGRSVLRELGSTTAQVTPHAGDQGIDFYGDITVGSLLNADPAILRLMHETKVIVVGQAKHYPTTVIGPAIVRELVGALSLSRTYTYSRDDLDLLNGVELRPFSPVLALLFSTGTFTKGARHLAKRAGLIVFSGWQLAVFLADKGIGIVHNGGVAKFEPTAFDAWLE
ncbi:restriction endonuclease [Rhizobium laguerreae]|uniref:restriction endonuclease n=1 Tax=Rhizobium laguerreae TaxID=1076926 RepID=UPI001478DA91|nr:restriction endonuclease [Rhizobium laguerreae]NNH58859.1 restriction endonuclease [Rhizobium laguerreae]